MVAITDRYRKAVEKRRRERRVVLLPMRVTMDDKTLFEGATLDVSTGGIYFRMPRGERLSVGTRLRVEMSVPAELSGSPLGYHTMREARVVRVDSATLARRVGCHPRQCGVAVAFEPEVAAAAARHSETVPAVA
ncbi:MAG TPA: PilZ domain-containing protein [Planctomycetota bacterium]|nr:PilZ domain-containing protein [Planctomycetota bacterium]